MDLEGLAADLSARGLADDIRIAAGGAKVGIRS